MEDKPQQRRSPRGPAPLETDYLSLYQEYVQGLRPGANSNYMGFCPIHGETPGKSKPSLSVNSDTGLWYCFAGCGGGNARTFLKELGEKRSTIVRKMENLPKAAPGSRRRVKNTEKDGITVLPEKLLGVFDFCPTSLLREGFDEDLLFDHDIGYDRKLRRVTFPIRNQLEELVGIVGRRTEKTEYGKYKVYTRELLEYGLTVTSFSKTNYLWREDRVLNKELSDIYVVEGFKAALWFVQSGIENVVALMGSHMSELQQKKLGESGRRILLCLDNDVAGQKATIKISNQLAASRRFVIPLPEGIHQPDDLTEEELRDLCEAPITISKAKRQWQTSL
jgi:DNA primase